MNIFIRNSSSSSSRLLLERSIRSAWSGVLPARSACVSAFSTSNLASQEPLADATVENTSAAAAKRLPIPANRVIDTLERHDIRRVILDLGDRLIPVEILPTWSERVLVQVYVDEDSTCNASNNNDNNPHLAIGDINIDRAGVGLDIGIDFPQDNTSSSNSELLFNVRMYVPQVCDVSVRSGQDVKIFDKVEGDVQLQSTHGDITVNKVRGTSMRFSAPSGHITATSLIEGRTVMLHADKSIEIKRLMASSNVSVTSDSGDVSMDSCYTTAVAVTATNGKVSVSALHGSLNAVADNAIKVVGVDGDVTAKSSIGDVTVVFDRVSKGQRSTLVADSGNVYVTVPSDLKCETDFELNAKKVTIPSGENGVANSSNRWANTSSNSSSNSIDSKDERVQELNDGSQVFKGGLAAHLSSSRGVLSPLQRTGKINYNASRNAKWEASPADSASTPTPSSSSSSLEKWKLSANAPNGHVTVKMLSWIESVIGTVPGLGGPTK